jgi:NitT/TauT family transport system permease protein
MPDAPSPTTRRPEIVRPLADTRSIADVREKLSPVERIWGNEAVRKFTIIILLIALWQMGAMWKNNALIFPTFAETAKALAESLKSGVLIERTLYSLKLLAIGYAIGVALAAILSIFATWTRIGNDLLETLTAMFSPLPAIALVPLAMIWFGLGAESLVFVLVHSVLWPVALNMHSGFRSVSPTMRMVGANYDLGRLRLVRHILFPAAFPSILTGLKIGWAFAWRTLIAAELVFGVSSDSGGLGWFIFENKNTLEIPAVFAGLLTVILIGLAVENLIFRTIEVRTVRRWGMQG